MKIKINAVPEQTIEEFADEHNLTMIVNERPNSIGRSGRYYAHFEGAELSDGMMLIGVYGDGSSPEEAIANYAPQISEKLIVIDATRPERREIFAPRIKAS